jgi:hypothetical protein
MHFALRFANLRANRAAIDAALAHDRAQRDGELERLRTLVAILTDDQPDGEEYDAAERALLAAWPDRVGGRLPCRLTVERIVRIALEAAWEVNHQRRIRRDRTDPVVIANEPVADVQAADDAGEEDGAADPNLCPLSRRTDKPDQHSWRFDGDDPRIFCVFCGQVRDADFGTILFPGRRASTKDGAE